MTPDPLETLKDILTRSGHDLNLRENEEHRYFLFDRISDPGELDLAWSLFPAHQEVRARATQVDSVSDIVPGWGYRIPKKSNRCSETELIELLRTHVTAIRPFLWENYDDVIAFLDKGYDIQIVGKACGDPPDPVTNNLFMAFYETMGDFMGDHCAFEEPLLRILYDWAIYLTKCDEVACLAMARSQRCCEYAGHAVSGTCLVAVQLRTNDWVKDGDLESRTVCVQPPWAR